MKTDDQRIAIAEACKAKRLLISDGFMVFQEYDEPKNQWFTYCRYLESDRALRNFIRNLPDYLNDLNEMHEAIKSLTPKQLEEFALRLCSGERWKSEELNITDVVFAIQATAAQFAEAFLKTLNLWKQ